MILCKSFDVSCHWRFIRGIHPEIFEAAKHLQKATKLLHILNSNPDNSPKMSKLPVFAGERLMSGRLSEVSLLRVSTKSSKKVVIPKPAQRTRQVALLIETSGSYGRGLLRGVA